MNGKPLLVPDAFQTRQSCGRFDTNMHTAENPNELGFETRIGCSKRPVWGLKRNAPVATGGPLKTVTFTGCEMPVAPKLSVARAARLYVPAVTFDQTTA